MSKNPKLGKADSELLEWLFHSEYKDLFDYVRHILYISEWAEDAVEEVFVIGIEKISDLRDSPNQVGWLYRTLQNVVSNKNREAQRLGKLIEKVKNSSDSGAVGIEPSFEQHILFNNGYKGLLKEADWNILIDFYCRGYKYKDLSEKYGKSISACKMQVMRAKNILAKKLKENSDE